MSSPYSDAQKDGVPLIQAITAATRAGHTKLNKMIVARMPLALPPATSDPTRYTSGLIHIMAIYKTFENEWDAILASPPTLATDKLGADREAQTLDAPRQVHISKRIHKILSDLHLPDLRRSARLEADIRQLTGWSAEAVHDNVQRASASMPLADFVKHIRRSIDLRPHVLMAYTYILYMALFAGGRFIRDTLRAGGEEFWSTGVTASLHGNASVDRSSNTQEEITDEQDASEDTAFPLRFFQFSTDSDGEDLKMLYKQQFVDSGFQLSGPERDDIVREAVCIFEHMILLVQQLDSLRANPQPIPARRGSLYALGQMLNPIATRIRDSVLIAKERDARKNSNDSTASDSTGTVIRHGDSPTPSSGSESHSPAESDAESPEHPTLPIVTGVELASAISSKKVRLRASASLQESSSLAQRVVAATKESTSVTSYVIAGAVAAAAVGLGIAAMQTRTSVAA